MTRSMILALALAGAIATVAPAQVEHHRWKSCDCEAAAKNFGMNWRDGNRPQIEMKLHPETQRLLESLATAEDHVIAAVTWTVFGSGVMCGTAACIVLALVSLGMRSR